MASSREERFLMRQRGAGARELRDSGFGLDIPDAANTPVQQLSSGRKTRASLNKPQTSPKSTPRTYSKKTPQSDGRRQSSSTKRSGPRARQLESPSSARKKRRLATPVEAIPEETVEEEAAVEETIVEEPEETEEPPEPAVLEEQEEQEVTVTTPENDEKPEDETGKSDEEETQANTTGSREQSVSSTTSNRKRKKRKSISQQSMRKKRKSNLSNEITIGEGGEEEEDDSQLLQRSTKQSLRGDIQVGTTKGPLEPADGNAERSAPEELLVEEANQTSASGNKIGRPAGQRTSLSLERETPSKHLKSTTVNSSGKRRGRPRKSVVSSDLLGTPTAPNSVGRPRGRPRKNVALSASKETGDGATKTRGGESNEGTKAQNEQAERHSGDDEPLVPTKQKKRRKSEGLAATLQKESVQSSLPNKTQNRKQRDTARAAQDDVEASTAQVHDTQQHEAVRATKPRELPEMRETDSDALVTKGKAVSVVSTKKRGRPRKSDATTDVTATGPSSAKHLASEQVSEPIDAEARPQKKTKEGGIPVLVHRLSKPQLLNYVQDDEDDLAGPAPPMKKTGVNAIDVLAQISREIVAKFVESLTVNAQREQGQKKAEWKRKKRVVELFNDELQSRLLHMTTALDHNQGLTMRLKQVNKTKAAYREELLALRREREELAIQMDAVRIKHDRSTENARGANDLNTALHDIELAVQRGRAAQQQQQQQQQQPHDPDEGNAQVIGLEARIRQVADGVSSAGSRQSLLDRVKKYNAYLEAAVGAL